MKLLRVLKAVPTGLILGLLLAFALLGSHFGLDLLIGQSVGQCIPVDASTKLCLVPVAD